MPTRAWESGTGRSSSRTVADQELRRGAHQGAPVRRIPERVLEQGRAQHAGEVIVGAVEDRGERVDGLGGGGVPRCPR